MTTWIYTNGRLEAYNEISKKMHIISVEPWAAPLAELLNVNPELSRLLEKSNGLGISPKFDPPR